MADATLTEERPRPTAGTATREDRLLAIDTPLGKDKLVLTELSGYLAAIPVHRDHAVRRFRHQTGESDRREGDDVDQARDCRAGADQRHGTQLVIGVGGCPRLSRIPCRNRAMAVVFELHDRQPNLSEPDVS